MQGCCSYWWDDSHLLPQTAKDVSQFTNVFLNPDYPPQLTQLGLESHQNDLSLIKAPLFIIQGHLKSTGLAIVKVSTVLEMGRLESCWLSTCPFYIFWKRVCGRNQSERASGESEAMLVACHLQILLPSRKYFVFTKGCVHYARKSR